MNIFNPDHLLVTFKAPLDVTDPISGRKYTLTHSDQTGCLFLTVALNYAYDKITQMRDEVLAEWCIENGTCILSVKVYLGGRDIATVKRRDQNFRRELPLALEAIFFGDRAFLMAHQQLYSAPIKICFESSYPSYNRCENWGTPMDYLFIAH
ncbi:staygreen family protein [Amphibacillus cookii]|uniref:staygreen family protein n=1 Tax=Amphibacillus cookii TaxID=767787 RepID=UPI00195C1F40|nr:staygreen family protein [Amphibacillus cookii]MBM7541992.1 hypothetical protein [Amphibacillus cookii]